MKIRGGVLSLSIPKGKGRDIFGHFRVFSNGSCNVLVEKERVLKEES